MKVEDSKYMSDQDPKPESLHFGKLSEDDSRPADYKYAMQSKTFVWKEEQNCLATGNSLLRTYRIVVWKVGLDNGCWWLVETVRQSGSRTRELYEHDSRSAITASFQPPDYRNTIQSRNSFLGAHRIVASKFRCQ